MKHRINNLRLRSFKDFWHRRPLKPGGQVHFPVKAEHNPPFKQGLSRQDPNILSLRGNFSHAAPLKPFLHRHFPVRLHFPPFWHFWHFSVQIPGAVQTSLLRSQFEHLGLHLIPFPEYPSGQSPQEMKGIVALSKMQSTRGWQWCASGQGTINEAVRKKG